MARMWKVRNSHNLAGKLESERTLRGPGREWARRTIKTVTEDVVCMRVAYIALDNGYLFGGFL